MKQKNGQLAMLIVNNFANANALFLELYCSKHVNFKSGKVEETQFCMNFERELEFSSNKNKVSGRVKMDSFNINNEPFDKC